MYRRIALAYDGSTEGRAALREGALLAARFDAEIHLLSVISSGGMAAVADAASGSAELRSRWDQILQEGLTRVKHYGLRTRGQVLHGEPAHVVGRYVLDYRIELLVVGHRRQSLLDRWWAGATGAYLADYVGCSLLIGRNVLSEDQFKSEMADLGRLPAL